MPSTSLITSRTSDSSMTRDLGVLRFFIARSLSLWTSLRAWMMVPPFSVTILIALSSCCCSTTFDDIGVSQRSAARRRPDLLNVSTPISIPSMASSVVSTNGIIGSSTNSAPSSVARATPLRIVPDSGEKPRLYFPALSAFSTELPAPGAILLSMFLNIAISSAPALVTNCLLAEISSSTAFSSSQMDLSERPRTRPRSGK